VICGVVVRFDPDLDLIGTRFGRPVETLSLGFAELISQLPRVAGLTSRKSETLGLCE